MIDFDDVGFGAIDDAILLNKSKINSKMNNSQEEYWKAVYAEKQIRDYPRDLQLSERADRYLSTILDKQEKQVDGGGFHSKYIIHNKQHVYLKDIRGRYRYTDRNKTHVTYEGVTRKVRDSKM